MILTLPEAWCSTLFTSDCSFTWPSGRAIEVTRCAITRCREIMTPQLSIVKTRFAKASLRPRCARHRSWGATCLFPNACVGHSASQLMRWTLSFPIDALDTQLPSSRDGSSSKITERAEHPSTSGPLLSVPTIELLHSITLSITGITRG